MSRPVLMVLAEAARFQAFGDDVEDTRDGVAELLAASHAYYAGYCQDEADERGPEYTGCSQEQHEAAKRLRDAIARCMGGK